MLRDLLDELGHERVTVVGHSLGGGIAMTFAYHYPERVERLALISSGGLGRDVNACCARRRSPGAGALMRTLGARPAGGRGPRAGGALAALKLRRPARATLDVVRTLERLGDSGRRGAFLKTVRAVIDGRGQKVLALDRLDVARPHARAGRVGDGGPRDPGVALRAAPRRGPAGEHRADGRDRPRAAPLPARVRGRAARRRGCGGPAPGMG